MVLNCGGNTKEENELKNVYYQIGIGAADYAHTEYGQRLNLSQLTIEGLFMKNLKRFIVYLHKCKEYAFHSCG